MCLDLSVSLFTIAVTSGEGLFYRQEASKYLNLRYKITGLLDLIK